MSDMPPTDTNGAAPPLPEAKVDVNPMTDEGARPWHNTDNPLEALFLHFTAEIAALKAKLSPKAAPVVQPDPPPASTYQQPAQQWGDPNSSGD